MNTLTPLTPLVEKRKSTCDVSSLVEQVTYDFETTSHVWLSDYLSRYTRQGIKQAITKAGYNYSEITANHRVIGFRKGFLIT